MRKYYIDPFAKLPWRTVIGAFSVFLLFLFILLVGIGSLTTADPGIFVRRAESAESINDSAAYLTAAAIVDSAYENLDKSVKTVDLEAGVNSVELINSIAFGFKDEIDEANISGQDRYRLLPLLLFKAAQANFKLSLAKYDGGAEIEAKKYLNYGEELFVKASTIVKPDSVSEATGGSLLAGFVGRASAAESCTAPDSSATAVANFKKYYESIPQQTIKALEYLECLGELAKLTTDDGAKSLAALENLLQWLRSSGDAKLVEMKQLFGDPDKLLTKEENQSKQKNLIALIGSAKARKTGNINQANKDYENTINTVKNIYKDKSSGSMIALAYIKDLSERAKKGDKLSSTKLDYICGWLRRNSASKTVVGKDYDALLGFCTVAKTAPTPGAQADGTTKAEKAAITQRDQTIAVVGEPNPIPKDNPEPVPPASSSASPAPTSPTPESKTPVVTETGNPAADAAAQPKEETPKCAALEKLTDWNGEPSGFVVPILIREDKKGIFESVGDGVSGVFKSKAGKVITGAITGNPSLVIYGILGKDRTASQTEQQLKQSITKIGKDNKISAVVIDESGKSLVWLTSSTAGNQRTVKLTDFDSAEIILNLVLSPLIKESNGFLAIKAAAQSESDTKSSKQGIPYHIKNFSVLHLSADQTGTIPYPADKSSGFTVQLAKTNQGKYVFFKPTQRVILLIETDLTTGAYSGKPGEGEGPFIVTDKDGNKVNRKSIAIDLKPVVRVDCETKKVTVAASYKFLLNGPFEVNKSLSDKRLFVPEFWFNDWIIGWSESGSLGQSSTGAISDELIDSILSQPQSR